MASLQTAGFWARFFEIGFLNLLLSGDNAVVIALAVRMLPRRQRLFGQVWGTIGAVVLRLLFVGIVSALLSMPLLRLIGGALLVWIAVKLVRPAEEPAAGPRHGSSLWEAIGIIIVADLTMSLDNVLAIAAAARGDMWLVVLGIATSLPIVVWGSGVLARLMNRHGWIIWLGGGVLGYVAGEMILDDPLVSRHHGVAGPWLGYLVSGGLGVMVAALGWQLARRQKPPPATSSAPLDSAARPRHPKRRGAREA